MTDTLVGMISTVGFPIVAFLLMFYHNTKTIEKLESAIKIQTMATKELILEIRRPR